MRALAADSARAIREPLGDLGITWSTGIRTGDTPAAERARQDRRFPTVLVTTPESLYLLLTSNARDAFRGLDTLIIDEIHALVPTKRGAHLALSIERLAHFAEGPIQRIGLSATQRPLEEIARLLGGHGDDGRPRRVTIVDAGHRKPMEL